MAESNYIDIAPCQFEDAIRTVEKLDPGETAPQFCKHARDSSFAATATTAGWNSSICSP